MKAVIVINYASEEDIGKKTSIHLLNEENEWVEDVVIKPLPLKGTMENVDECEYNRGFVDGRNHCIELITGETE